MFQDCHIDQLAGSLASLSQSDTKRQTWKIRPTRKYVQKSSNKYKAITLTVVKIQYQVIPLEKNRVLSNIYQEQWTFYAIFSRTQVKHDSRPVFLESVSFISAFMLCPNKQTFLSANDKI